VVFGEAEGRSPFLKGVGGRPHEGHLCPRCPENRFPRTSRRGLHFLLPPDWRRAATTNGAGRRLAGLPAEGRRRTRRARALRRQLCPDGGGGGGKVFMNRSPPPVGGATNRKPAFSRLVLTKNFEPVTENLEPAPGGGAPSPLITTRHSSAGAYGLPQQCEALCTPYIPVYDASYFVHTPPYWSPIRPWTAAAAACCLCLHHHLQQQQWLPLLPHNFLLLPSCHLNNTFGRW